jgi:hypothetical protein
MTDHGEYLAHEAGRYDFIACAGCGRMVPAGGMAIRGGKYLCGVCADLPAPLPHVVIATTLGRRNLMPNKEQTYDAEISPLMAQIIAICQKNKISMYATFDTPNDEDGSVTCTTCLADESGKPSPRIQAFNRLSPHVARTMMITTEHADGSKVMTAVLG